MIRLGWIILAVAGCLAADSNGDLLAAARGGDAATVRALLEKGAAIETPTPYGQTPLYLAAMNGHEEVVRLLLEKGAKTEVRDTFYKAPMLTFALMRKHYGVAKLLVEKGGGTPDENLNAVGMAGRAELVQAALAKGKPSQPALDKAYEYALDQKQSEIAEALKGAGAQPPAAAAEIDAKVLASYAGAYKSEQFPLEMKMFLKEGKLAMQATGQPDFSPKPKTATQFEFAPAGIEIEFDSADSFTLKQMGRTFKFKKAVSQ